MSQTNHREEVEQQGYTIVRDVLSPEEVQQLRSFLLPILDSDPVYEGDTEVLRCDIAARYPELRFLLWKEGLAKAVREVLGEDFVFLPEMSVHDALFGAWHKDTDSPESVGHEWMWQSDFRMVEVGFYLQDNDDHGGGLDIVPRSHKRRASDLLNGPRTLLRRTLRRKAIPSKAGDMVIFDFRIDHRATQPRAGALTGNDRKIAIFFPCSANTEHARQYREFIQGREDYVYLRDHSYPADLLEQAEQNRVTLMG